MRLTRDIPRKRVAAVGIPPATTAVRRVTFGVGSVACVFLMPVSLPAMRPSSMYPACEIELYASSRLIFVWLIAARLPSVSVRTATAARMGSHIERASGNAVWDT